jgi:hypothetical protein
MTHLEQVRESINEPKTAPLRTRANIFSRITTFFKYLPKDEKSEHANAFYQWAESTCDPLKFSYAKFLLGMYHFTVEEFERALQLLPSRVDNLRILRRRWQSKLCCSPRLRTGLGNIDLALKLSWSLFAVEAIAEKQPSALEPAQQMANINLSCII